MCSRPAVSTISTSYRRAFAASQASCATDAGSESCFCLMMSHPSRPAHTVSCSTAAARNVSHAATATFFPSVWSRRASFAIEVVFPDPFTPAIITTVGPVGA